ncbi:MAG TPA: HEAT repeat domain-containing protein [Planctomycetota bacterium]|nr:HEAT repeat domain-containing protein [Planctomycetota bacterium]
MRRGWIVFLLAAGAGAQEFSEADLDRAIREVGRGEHAALDRIAKWGPKAARATPALIGAWGVRGFRGPVEAALWAIGPDTIPELVKLARSKHPRASYAEELLARFVGETPAAPLDPALEPKLFAMLNDADARTRRAAAAGLATLGAAVVPRLVELLADKSWRRREAAALALGRVDPPPEQAAGTLLTAAHDPKEEVRTEAIFALGRLHAGSKESLAIMLEAAADPSERVAGRALDALEAGGKERVPDLLAAWDKGGPAARAATEVLARLGEPALDQVVEAIRTGGPGARKRFGALYLGWIGTEFDLSLVDRTLIPFLTDEDAEVRAAAAEAFGVALPEIAARSLDPLLAAATDKDARVRASALAAAARGAPDDPRVKAAVEKAKADIDASVNLTAALVANTSTASETWTRAVADKTLPVAARVLAAERIRALPTGFAEMLPTLSKITTDPAEPADVRAATAFTLRLLLSRVLFEDRGPPRDPPARNAVEKALKWLAETQAKDGRWEAKAWNNYDLGVTGLAILAFLAAGHTHREITGKEPYAATIRDGLKFITACQHESGLFILGEAKQHSIVEHAIATQALVEAVAMTGDRKRRPVAERAIAVCEYARTPDLAWRYEPRSRENDTHVTSWMISTLRVADAAGFTVDPDAYEGARQWIDKMTEPNFGQVGYNLPGGAPFRAKDHNEGFPPEYSYSTTAAGIWMRMVLGEDPATSEMVKKGANLCADQPPTFATEGAADFYYWYYGTLACWEAGGIPWRKWDESFRDAVLDRQESDGSWAPEDAWGFAGGRVYSTAILTLALLTPTRYPRGWCSLERKEPYLGARDALERARQSASVRVRSAALGRRPK